MSLQAACMEPTVVSSPPGAAHWEPFPLGFQTLDPDEPGHAGSGFSREDEEDTLQEDLITVSSFSFEGGHSNISRDDSCFKGLSFKDDFEGLDEISDSTLSWLFSPARKESTLTPESPPDTSSSLCVQGDLISLSVPSSPSNVSRRNSASDEGEPFWLLDLSDELPGDSSGDLNAQVVAEEQEGLPPSQSRKTLTPETRDEVLFPDQVTDLPLTGIAAEQGLSESCRSPDHSREPPEGLAGPVPLLNLDVPDFDSGAGSAVRAAVPNDVSAEMSAAPAEAAVIGPVPPAEGSENGSVPLAASDRLSFLTLPVEEDVRLHNESNSVALMEDQNSLTAITEPDQERMAFDPCLTVEEVHGDSWDVGGANVPPSDHHQPASLDPSAQDVNVSSQEARWTNEQAVETIQRSETPANARQENASPLKAVFDALDQDGDGFVRIEEFMAFAAAYGADQVKDFTKFLDPSGLGVISFEDFHRGISAISNGGPEPQLYDYSPGDGAVGCPEEYDEQNEVTDSAYLGSESTYSECETFTDEDTAALVPPEMHEDVETDSGIEATLHDAEDGGSRFSLNSELHSHSLVTVISGEEEHFEDFGESNTSELDGSVGDADSALAPPADQVDGSAVVSPSAPASLPDCFQSFLREETLDFFCSQCHKQISRLEDLSTRLNFLEMTSAGKRLSSKKVARHLLQNSSMTLDTMSDLTRDILELADNDITDKVLLLERRVAELEKESETSGEQHARLRQENLHLVHRANALEEQLKEQELQTDERLQQESRRHKEALSKLEREKGLELENLQARLQQLDEENGELRSCVPCLRANIERLEEEKRKLQDEVETVSDRLDEETESRRKMADKLSHERHQNQKEKESTQELIEDLRKQLEHLQLYKLEAEAKRGRTPGAGLQEYQSRTREAELEQEIKRLKQDNRTLKEQNDELNGQIINLSIQGAKNLMSTSFSDSLAAEINSVSRAELMEAVHKQEEINYRLQDYIDKIIVAIMECNPSMLEVK